MCDPFDFDNDGEISLDEEILGTGLLLDMLDDEESDDESED